MDGWWDMAITPGPAFQPRTLDLGWPSGVSGGDHRQRADPGLENDQVRMFSGAGSGLFGGY
jgi:hypothetical protein